VLVVVALGGNALLRRGETFSIATQEANIRAACAALAPVAAAHDLVVTHGNGPQVGWLADTSADFPLDILDAETQGMIGYQIERELRAALPLGRETATVLTMVEVDPHDPAFANPTKPVGRWLNEPTARADWTVKRVGDAYRRVVPSPKPQRILQLPAIRALVERHCVVVCAGGGGIPVTGCSPVGVEAVIDKDLASSLLARELRADVLILATDVDGVYANWGEPSQRRLRRLYPDLLRAESFAAGSMRPKVEAACAFAADGGVAAIGSLDELEHLIDGSAGTTVAIDAPRAAMLVR
jgi:carbamate kinase